MPRPKIPQEQLSIWASRFKLRDGVRQRDRRKEALALAPDIGV